MSSFYSRQWTCWPFPCQTDEPSLIRVCPPGGADYYIKEPLLLTLESQSWQVQRKLFGCNYLGVGSQLGYDSCSEALAPCQGSWGGGGESPQALGMWVYCLCGSSTNYRPHKFCQCTAAKVCVLHRHIHALGLVSVLHVLTRRCQCKGQHSAGSLPV